MKKRTLLSWSSGKDSAWSLHVLQQDPEIEVVGLVSTINEKFDRVAMHAVRVELLKRQAKAVGLPLHIISLPYPCSNEIYESRMNDFFTSIKHDEIECMAFGDLYLEDIRQYRESRMKDTGITPLFPLWGIPTDELANTMVQSGLRAQITCIDPKKLDPAFAGREYNASLIIDLPDSVDPCGENGEFHSFCFAGPMFNQPVEITVGETVEREGFVFTDLLA
ncbi:MAG: adenine nucleotide alpha hydrolase [Gammaproteobacteria bacterium]|nr:adenine nucleotide alpha hydrolase [Gammaproteobacteria bacterium]